MLVYSDYFEQISAAPSYFAGANTPKGFSGEYQNLFCEDTFEKIYIIKGGSGTGKSTMIRKCALAGEECGANVTYILCSSDPDSLDGVIIEKDGKKIGVTDGTAPHTLDPVYAGACGEIVNCGDYWNCDVLEREKGRITDIIKMKEGDYKRAYNYLSAAGEIFGMQKLLSLYCADIEKMRGAARRLAAELRCGEGRGNIIYRRTMAISMKGAVRVTTFERAKKLVAVNDCTFMSPLFYKILLEELLSRGIDVTVSLSPVFDIGELYVEKYGVAYVPYRQGVDYVKKMNLSRFADKERMAKVKQKRIFSSKCLAAVMEGASECLREAGDCHFALEEIYKAAMDFGGLDALGDSIAKNIMKRFS